MCLAVWLCKNQHLICWKCWIWDLKVQSILRHQDGPPWSRTLVYEVEMRRKWSRTRTESKLLFKLFFLRWSQFDVWTHNPEHITVKAQSLHWVCVTSLKVCESYWSESCVEVEAGVAPETFLIVQSTFQCNTESHSGFLHFSTIEL